MRVAFDHLVRQRLGDVGEIERAKLFGHAGVEGDLEEEVAQLFLERGHIGPLDRVGDFVGFLDRVGRDGREGLFDVPRAAMLRVAQARHHVEHGLRGGCVAHFAIFLRVFRCLVGHANLA
jgi:hypothetical protein